MLAFGCSFHRRAGHANRVLDVKDDKPIVYREYKDPWEQFDYRAYPKGAWVLHMLRGVVGEDAFWTGIQTYYAEFQDLNAIGGGGSARTGPDRASRQGKSATSFPG